MTDPDGSTPVGVNQADLNPVGSFSSASMISYSGALPRVEAGDVLSSWDNFGSWQRKNARTIRFFGAMSADGVVAPDFESHAHMILTARLASSMMRTVTSTQHLLDYGSGCLTSTRSKLLRSRESLLLALWTILCSAQKVLRLMWVELMSTLQSSILLRSTTTNLW